MSILITKFLQFYCHILLIMFFDKKKYRYAPSPIGKIIIPFLPSVKILWKNGISMRCSLDNYYWLKCCRGREHEPSLERITSHVLVPGNVVIDAGAQIGILSVYFSKLVGDNGRVYSFEPHPANFLTLKKALTLNGCSNVRPINKGLSSKDGKLNFWEALPSGFTLLSSDRESWSSDVKDVSEVICVCIDDYISENDIDNVSLLKVDVDGNDFDVLLGAENLLKSNSPPFVIFESSIYWRNLNYNVADAVTYFRRLGYDLYVSQISSDRIFKLELDEHLPAGWGEERGKALNFFAIKNSLHKKRLESLLSKAESISKLDSSLHKIRK